MLLAVFLTCSPPALATQAGSCNPAWTPTFGPERSVDDEVEAMLVADQGTGPELFLGGDFHRSGPEVLHGVARWTGSGFAALGGGLGSSLYNRVLDLCVLPGAPAGGIHAFGSLSVGGGAARWNGTAWVPLGTGLDYVSPQPGILPSVARAELHDAGSGPELYVVGEFTHAGGQPASNFAKWNGAAWAAVPPPPSVLPPASDPVDLVSFDDGTGRALYAGGNNGVARLGPGGWQSVTSGAVSVSRFAVQDLGVGPELFAIGKFGAVPPGIEDVARWNGSSWTRLFAPFADLKSLGTHDFGAGPRLVASGQGRLSTWDGSSWLVLTGQLLLQTGGNGSALALQSFDDGSGSRLFVGGQFGRAGGGPAGNVARFDGTTWLGGRPGINAPVNALLPFHDGGAPVLFVGGDFTAIEGLPVSGIAKWDGSNWSSVGGSLHNGRVRALAAPDLGAGRQLIAGGVILTSLGDVGDGIQLWTGTSWQPLGSGIAPTGFLFQGVYALAEFDDGSGNALYVGGSFNTAGGLASPGIARWNGSIWSIVGGGGVAGPISPLVAALHVHDDGSGPALYAGGRFTSVAGVPADGVAKWNGTAWSAVSTGSTNGVVKTLATFDDGSGPQLYAGGMFSQLSGTLLSSLARWNGTTWSGLGPGFATNVDVLRGWDDGSGPALLVGGFSLPAGAMLASWNGSWTTIGPGSPTSPAWVHAVAMHDDGVSRGLFVGGWFMAPPSGDSSLAVLGCASQSAFTSYCSGDGSAAACPCGNFGAAGRGCASSMNPLGAQLSSSGTASVGNADLVLEGSGMPNAACLYFQGTSPTAGGTGASFGDGLRCAGGSVTRLGTRVNAGGMSSVPGPSEPSLAQKGGVPSGGGITLRYQVWYRNSASFCTPGTFNLSNGLSVAWGP